MTVKELKEYLSKRDDNDRVMISVRYKTENSSILICDRYKIDSITTGVDFKSKLSPKMDDYVNTVELIATLKNNEMRI